jgi:accessory secretory protein Asp1
MLYFVPAWYKHGHWNENEQSWHVRRMHTEFDDTVKHIQLFQRSGDYPYQIMLLSYAPNFRHFLHRQGVYRAPYWSCFDSVCEIRRKKAVLLSFRNMAWPENIEFIFSPFVVVAMLDKKKYAEIEFGEYGNPIRIDLYQ